MPRPYKIIKPRKIHVNLPEDMAARLELYLWSQGENRIPYGAMSKFFEDRVREFFLSIEGTLRV